MVRVRGWWVPPPGRDIWCYATSPWAGENLHHRGWWEAPGNFSVRHMYASAITHHNLQPQQTSRIWYTHGNYNPSRALVDGFCLLSTNIVAFRNCFQLNLVWRGNIRVAIIFLCIPIIITWTHAMQCTTNNEGVVCGQWWCIGGWVGVIESFRVGLCHLGTYVRAVKKVNTTKLTISFISIYFCWYFKPDGNNWTSSQC